MEKREERGEKKAKKRDNELMLDPDLRDTVAALN